MDPAELPGNAEDWLAAKHGALLSMIGHAATLGLDEAAWELTAAARDLFEQRDHIGDLTETHMLALAACERAGNRRGEAVMLYGRACVATRTPRSPAGHGTLELIEGARVRFRGLGEVDGEVDALVLAGSVYRMHGDHARSGELLEEAAERARAAGNETAEAAAWRSLGALHWERKRLDNARRCFARALDLARRAALPDVEAFALRGLGLVYRETGDWARALDYFSSALAGQERLGGQRGIAYALVDQGQVYTSCGDPRARDTLERALALHEQIGDVHGRAVALRALGELGHAGGDLPGATEYLTRSLALWRELRQPYGTALALRALGTVHRAAGDRAGARACWREAAVNFRTWVALRRRPNSTGTWPRWTPAWRTRPLRCGEHAGRRRASPHARRPATTSSTVSRTTQRHTCGNGPATSRSRPGCTATRPAPPPTSPSAITSPGSQLG